MTGKVQDHSNGAGLEVLCQKPQMRPSEPKQVLWDVLLTWSLTSGKMMAQEPPRSPGSARVAMSEGGVLLQGASCLHRRAPAGSGHAAAAGLLDYRCLRRQRCTLSLEGSHFII